MGLFDVGNISVEGKIKDYYDVVIIGAGPGGLTAGIYAKRSGLSVAIFEMAVEGGYMAQTYLIDNYPGFPSIAGKDLASKIFKQVKDLGVDTLSYEVRKIENGNLKSVELENGKVVRSKVVIVATGAIPKKLGVPGEKEFIGHGISFCATCDGYLFSNKRVVVVGGGDSALSESIFLSKMAGKVVILHRRDKLRAVKSLQEKVFSNNKITVDYNKKPLEFIGDTKLTGIRVEDTVDGTSSLIKCDGAFIFIGLSPRSQLVASLVDLDENGYVVTNENMETRTRGLYVIGDLRKKNLRQIITAMSDAAIAVGDISHNYF
jgi:thioredoxin reductase (NADPH)